MMAPLRWVDGFPPGVRAVVSLRGQHSGEGASRAPYDHFNLGLHVGDDPTHVALNRAVFEEAIAARVTWLNQVHGTDCHVLSASDPRTPGDADAPRADACLTREQGQACTMMVADCLPVLVCLWQRDSAELLRPFMVGAAHAGWRGLAAGVVGSLVTRMVTRLNSAQAHGMTAWLGPCIGANAFEVGPEVPPQFEPDLQHHFRPAPVDGKWLGSLKGIAQAQLEAATQAHGLELKMVSHTGSEGGGSACAPGEDPDCTVSQRPLYFSHRRDGRSGRMAAAIWLESPHRDAVGEEIP